MTMTVSAAALTSILPAQTPAAGSAGQASAAGMFDEIMTSLQPTVEQNPWAGLANYGQGKNGAGGQLPSPWEQYSGQSLTQENLVEMARELKVQADTRSIASMALHKILDGIQDTARTLTRQS
jgi:hypothetical protein